MGTKEMPLIQLTFSLAGGLIKPPFSQKDKFRIYEGSLLL